MAKHSFIYIDLGSISITKIFILTANAKRSNLLIVICEQDSIQPEPMLSSGRD
jgi:hypothetical protein